MEAKQFPVEGFGEAIGDENVPPDESLPTPRAAMTPPHVAQSDPLAQTVKSATVTTMRSFWETKTRPAREARDSLGGTPRSGRSCRSSAKDGCSPRGAVQQAQGAPCGERGAPDERRSHSASVPRRQGAAAAARFQRDIANFTEQQKLMEDSTAQLLQWAMRLRRGTDAVSEDSPRRSSGSESEPPSEVDHDEESDEGPSMLRPLVKAFRESTSAIWKNHRQAVRVMILHLDRLYPKPQGGGVTQGGGSLAVATDQEQEPAWEPDAGA